MNRPRIQPHESHAAKARAQTRGPSDHAIGQALIEAVATPHELEIIENAQAAAIDRALRGAVLKIRHQLRAIGGGA